MNIQWYPGHMNKARRILKESLKLVDIVVELLDARIPVSSRNPDIENLLSNKMRITVLNKIDLADESFINNNKDKLNLKGNLIFVDSTKGRGLKQLLGKINSLMKEKFERDKSKGKVNNIARIMVVGIPNVGKSTFINKLTGRATAKTGNKPGVTRQNQWVRVKKDIELLDTPGILWPKFEDELTGLNLAFTGAIKDEIIDIEGVALKLIDCLKENYLENLIERYKIDILKEEEALVVYERIATKRGFYLARKNIDYFRTANALLDDFRSGKLGRITLDK